MMKLHLIYLTVCSLSQAMYINRNMIVNRLQHRPMAFRPGVMLQRPWHPRLVPAASHRAPYVIYRAPQHSQHRYAVKHFNPATRNIFPGMGGLGAAWKPPTRLPPAAPVATEQEFIRAASAQPVHTNGGTG